eukprot:CAMPEP_0114139134 /NCGR_PEP_ID=MMETSP0043_2-20121206/16694_1 /TAXON_ID=464988 /ORGANISM="Hemiselmis andersenii, Strain CCMP644" /LENGTH=79 /DNA_ID=CAMNT_0001233151 /DNA_START=264 /DNA_END=499 /DNA_ORIENTATION=-
MISWVMGHVHSSLIRAACLSALSAPLLAAPSLLVASCNSLCVLTSCCTIFPFSRESGRFSLPSSSPTASATSAALAGPA